MKSFIKGVLLFTFFMLPFVLVHGQQKMKKSLIDGHFRHDYEALRSDTAVKSGYYRLYYKDKLIEKGSFYQGKKAGLWQYYNLQGIFEFEYDYLRERVVRLSGDRDPKVETPCLFKGSPLIPYIFIARNVFYPVEAREQKINGKVVLTLKINEKGEVWAMYISQKLHPLMDSEVLTVAKRFPAHWQWLPATKAGVPIEGEYLITVYFEID